jgi:hypothetical protein
MTVYRLATPLPGSMFCRHNEQDEVGDVVVAEVRHADPEGRFHPSIEWFECPPWVRDGFIYDVVSNTYLPPNEHWVWDEYEGVYHPMPPDPEPEPDAEETQP